MVSDIIIDGGRLKSFFGHKATCKTVEKIVFKQKDLFYFIKTFGLIVAQPQKLACGPGSGDFGLTCNLVYSLVAKMFF